jgi:hypothetical protein
MRQITTRDDLYAVRSLRPAIADLDPGDPKIVYHKRCQVTNDSGLMH